MTRCTHDTVFQRVFYITLLVIAFTFTVIITNVFVDIDNIIIRNEDVTDAPIDTLHIYDVSPKQEDKGLEEDDDVLINNNEDFDYNAADLNNYRSKRSVASPINELDVEDSKAQGLQIDINNTTKDVNPSKSQLKLAFDNPINTVDKTITSKNNNAPLITLLSAKHINKLTQQITTYKATKPTKSKRHKRHIKVRIEDAKDRFPELRKVDDDELFLEIKARLNEKGEKKHFLIKNLVEKIEQALQRDGKRRNTTKHRRHRNLNVKKRLQSPLNFNTTKRMNRSSHIRSRHVDPIRRIAKDAKVVENSAINNDIRSVNVNSGEIDEKYYNKITHRFQLPINTDSSEPLNIDFKNLKYFVKNIDDTGFSIGLNHYVGEPPDPETFKIFNGLENLLKTYYRNYETETDTIGSVENSDHALAKRDLRWNDDDPATFYKVFDEKDKLIDPLGYPRIEKDDAVEGRMNERPEHFESIATMDVPSIVSEGFLERQLKPIDILNMADVLNRDKRYITLDHFNTAFDVNFKRKNSIQRIMLQERQKRQLSTLYRDEIEDDAVPSKENVFADRAVLTENDATNRMNQEVKEPENVVINEEQPIKVIIKAGEALMGKYPHIFYDPGQKEFEENPERLLDKENFGENTETKGVQNSVPFDPEVNTLDKLVRAITPLNNEASYRLVVKVSPKARNVSSNAPKFKEIHTSLNKRFNKNGVRYYTSFNVSGVAKVEDLLHKKEAITQPTAVRKQKKRQDKIKNLLEIHKSILQNHVNNLRRQQDNIERIIMQDAIDHGNKKEVVIDDDKNQLRRHEYSDEKPKKELEKITVTTKQVPSPITTTVKPIEITVTVKQSTKKSLETQRNDITKQSLSLTKNVILKVDKNTELLNTLLKKLEKIDKTLENNTKFNESRRFNTKNNTKETNQNYKTINEAPKIPFYSIMVRKNKELNTMFQYPIMINKNSIQTPVLNTGVFPSGDLAKNMNSMRSNSPTILSGY